MAPTESVGDTSYTKQYTCRSELEEKAGFQSFQPTRKPKLSQVQKSNDTKNQKSTPDQAIYFVLQLQSPLGREL